MAKIRVKTVEASKADTTKKAEAPVAKAIDVKMGPGDKMTGTDSLNVKLGLLHDYTEGLGKKIMSRSMQESSDVADKEMMDKSYMSDDRKHGAALQLRAAMMQAKRDNKPLDEYIKSASPAVKSLHDNFIKRASDDLISSGKHGEYQKMGEGLKSKD